jgi:hypothetical protein
MVGLEKINKKNKGGLSYGESFQKNKKRGGPSCMQNPA